MRRLVGIVGGAIVALLAIAPAAHAVPRVDVVHAETAKAGPYDVRVSFSDWPLRAERSLDILIEPAGGIEQRKGYLRMVSPSGKAVYSSQISGIGGGRNGELARHPRARDVWGLDIVALNEEGTWRFELSVNGPRGKGSGTLAVPVGPRPGPSAALSWTVGMLPLIVLVPIAGYTWVKTRSWRRREVASWA